MGTLVILVHWDMADQGLIMAKWEGRVAEDIMVVEEMAGMAAVEAAQATPAAPTQLIRRASRLATGTFTSLSVAAAMAFT